MTETELANNLRTQILSEAARLAGHRGLTHGTVAANMDHTADLWGAYLGIPIRGIDVAQMMVLLKMSRTKKGDSSTLDHYIDEAGYAAIAGEMARAKKSD